MQYYRCRCGKKEALASYPPASCEGCRDCNSTLELHSSMHRVPRPHEWVARYDNLTGKRYFLCKWCHERSEDLTNLLDSPDKLSVQNT